MNDTLNDKLIEIGFKRLKSESCIYIKKGLRKKKFNVTRYQQPIGNLLYPVVHIRPDILFLVNKASRKAKKEC